MVHVRLNESETNPNPFINFITALPMPDNTETESARQLLRALAAQVKPVMKQHGFTVNSLEEYEYNRVFAGRNWNNGETVELVLRRASGEFESPSWLLGTLCHELAHIKHMNHGSAFQALWSRLRNDVRALQAKGYYGDGFWSDGTRLADSARIASESANAGEFPEYICGGAQTISRPSRRRRVRQPRAGPSRSTGVQSAKRRKPGSRVTAAGAFVGEGQALNADIVDEDEKKSGSGFRKQTQSKRAREERVAAVERRLLALSKSSMSLPEKAKSPGSEDDDSDVETEDIEETDEERRKILGDTAGDEELSNLRSGTLMDFWGDFIVNPSTAPTDTSPRNSRSLETSPPSLQQTVLPSTSSLSKTSGIGKRLEQDIKPRKSQVLGTEPRSKGKTLEVAPGNPSSDIRRGDNSLPSTILDSPTTHESSSAKWSCKACTLENAPMHLSCAACGTTRGELWGDSYS